MKSTLAVLFSIFFFSASAQTLEKVWETDSIVAIPESVLADPQNGLLYVSLIDGEPWGADGRGGVARLKDDAS